MSDPSVVASRELCEAFDLIADPIKRKAVLDAIHFKSMGQAPCRNCLCITTVSADGQCGACAYNGGDVAPPSYQQSIGAAAAMGSTSVESTVSPSSASTTTTTVAAPSAVNADPPSTVALRVISSPVAVPASAPDAVVRASSRSGLKPKPAKASNAVSSARMSSPTVAAPTADMDAQIRPSRKQECAKARKDDERQMCHDSIHCPHCNSSRGLMLHNGFGDVMCSVCMTTFNDVDDTTDDTDCIVADADYVAADTYHRSFSLNSRCGTDIAYKCCLCRISVSTNDARMLGGQMEENMCVTCFRTYYIRD